ncbi:MAG TPA: zf-HC2 domain-containing protein [Candidatus Aminicenantes bacterium]|nr:zf-HC2 domain-containing protein [Candidatus Aminicenantes bacterium]
MKCTQITPKLIDLILGEIDDVTRKKVQKHLASCQSCRQELEELSQTWDKLGKLPESDPNPSLKMRFYTLMEKYRQNYHQEKQNSQKGWFFKQSQFRQTVFQSALVLIVVVLSVVTGYLYISNRQQTQEITRLHEKMDKFTQAVTALAYGEREGIRNLEPLLGGELAERNPDLLQILIETITGQDTGDLSLSWRNYLGLSLPADQPPPSKMEEDSLLVRLFLDLFLGSNSKKF